ncbi:MAG: 30S ribosomal protein S6 [Rickettsiales bacterium]|nr:30S ribosomal protein S6 [Rickettsiales bacterium]|tara:strand:- start:110 stop:538 length:429 start_codon:yes stop_codon:yes gene_type:complete
MYSREYELVFIVRPDVTDEDIEKIKDRSGGVIKDRKGHLLNVDDWGKRRLAYEIQDYGKGHFVLFNYLGSTEIVDELERTLKLDDSVLRFLTVKLAERVEVKARVAEAEAAAKVVAEAVAEQARAKEADAGSGDGAGAAAGA